MSGTYRPLGRHRRLTWGDSLFSALETLCVAAALIVGWIFGAAITIFLVGVAVRMGVQPLIDEAKIIRLLLEDLHDQYSVDAELRQAP